MGLRRMVISGELIAEVLSKGIASQVPVDMPEDITFIRATSVASNVNHKQSDLDIILESEEWKGPKDGELIPVIAPEFVEKK